MSSTTGDNWAPATSGRWRIRCRTPRRCNSATRLSSRSRSTAGTVVMRLLTLLRNAMVAQDVAVVPDALDNSGGISHDLFLWEGKDVFEVIVYCYRRRQTAQILRVVPIQFPLQRIV